MIEGRQLLRFYTIVILYMVMGLFLVWLQVSSRPHSSWMALNTSEATSPYHSHKDIYATVFWIGETASADNAYIHNEHSAWDKDWVVRYGGVDHPVDRNGFHPAGINPLENPFYVALPYNDLENGKPKENAKSIPWYWQHSDPNVSAVKNKWVQVSCEGQSCFGQWEDVGPINADDFEYVFLGKKPKFKAGIDISPAMRDCLNMTTNDYVDWQFVREEEVPDGPWKEIITISQINW